MKKAAVLGPKGTYSDLALDEYNKVSEIKYEPYYISSMLKLKNIIDDVDIAILPVENTIDGIILESLDIIIENKLKIVYELKEKIDFSYVGKDPDKVKKVYAQFKTYAQCLDFISKYNFDIIKTDSNTESLNLYLNNQEYGAIIPTHLVTGDSIDNVADKKENETKFAIVQKEFANKKFLEYNVSVLITSLEDRSGILFEILREFHDYDINLNSIMSRPLKTKIGQYNFYIECKISANDLYKLERLKNNLEKKFKVEIIGIYN